MKKLCSYIIRRVTYVMTYDIWIMGAIVAGIVAFLIVRKIKED
ncbi:MAG TPA: hypothetical protein VFG25_07855 [Nitrosopumilaceae archaeon]|nr:hypothetical protein [Nitrosopumilaceae archaeon]